MTWEYRIIDYELTEEELNELGSNGWELSYYNTERLVSVWHKYIFKRQKVE